MIAVVKELDCPCGIGGRGASFYVLFQYVQQTKSLSGNFEGSLNFLSDWGRELGVERRGTRFEGD